MKKDFKIIIAFLYLLLIFSAHSGLCQQNTITWYITPVFLRDYYGSILEDSSYVTLHMRFKCKAPQLIAFNYGEIYSRSFRECEKRSSESDSFDDLLSELDVSQILLQNEEGFTMPLMDNMISPPFFGERCRTTPVDISEHYNFDIIQLIPNKYVEVKLRYAIRYCALTVCSKSKKIRLIYVQKPNLYLQDIGVKKGVLVSEWFEISDIK